MTSKQLKKIFKTAKAEDIEAFLQVFNTHAKRYNIETSFQESAFLAQVLTEVGSDLKSVRENLNYTVASLKKTFGYYKRNPKHATRDGRRTGHKANQENIGNHAYANRIGNRSIGSGDGWHFRGGGFFQLTGRDNYARIGGKFPIPIGEEFLADHITTVTHGLISAMAFWQINGCGGCKDINAVTRIINRHTKSYAKREKHYKSIAKILA